MVQLKRGVAKLSRDVVYLGMVGCGAWAYRVHDPWQNLAKFVELHSSEGCHVTKRDVAQLNERYIVAKQECGIPSQQAW